VGYLRKEGQPVNIRLRVLAPIVVLAVLAIVLAVVFRGSQVPVAAVSPVSPLATPTPICCYSEPVLDTEEKCHLYWQEYYFDPDESDPWTQYAIEGCVGELIVSNTDVEPTSTP
jgi:hypothetical protein